MSTPIVNKSEHFIGIVAIGLSLQLPACASKTVAFSGNEKATLSLVRVDDAGGQGEVIGELPQTLEVQKVEGKVVKIWGNNIVPQYWFLRDVVGNETKVALKLEKSQQPDKEKPPTPPNLPYRLMMRAYAALASHQWKVARELSDELTKVEPNVSAPHVIKGISYLEEGQKQEAKAAFERAKALDPEDKDIDKLLKVVQ